MRRQQNTSSVYVMTDHQTQGGGELAGVPAGERTGPAVPGAAGVGPHDGGVPGRTARAGGTMGGEPPAGGVRGIACSPGIHPHAILLHSAPIRVSPFSSGALMSRKRYTTNGLYTGDSSSRP